MNSYYNSEGPECDECSRDVPVVFLVDTQGPVYTPISNENQIVGALVGCITKEKPNGANYTRESYKWFCEDCIRSRYGKSDT